MLCRLSYRLSYSVVWEPKKFSIIRKKTRHTNLLIKNLLFENSVKAADKKSKKESEESVEKQEEDAQDDPENQDVMEVEV